MSESVGGTEPLTGEEILGYCLDFFGNRDRMNAAIHCGQVRYSPITFALVRMIDASFDVSLLGTQTYELLRDVRNHSGIYELDSGR